MTKDPDATGDSYSEFDDPSRYDIFLKRDGDPRNVVDKYKTMKLEYIIEDLEANRQALHVAVENWEKDINLGTITRSANAYNVSGFHIVGEKGSIAVGLWQHIDISQCIIMKLFKI